VPPQPLPPGQRPPSPSEEEGGGGGERGGGEEEEIRMKGEDEAHCLGQLFVIFIILVPVGINNREKR
jgi:hypothetical protein